MPFLKVCLGLNRKNPNESYCFLSEYAKSNCLQICESNI